VTMATNTGDSTLRVKGQTGSMKRLKQQCVYCGATGKLTSDHIPPKNLFPQPRPANFVTVPCCLACNNGFASEDEYFRTMIACAEECAGHPEAEKLWKKILRQLHRTGDSAIPELIRQSFGSTADVTEIQIKRAELRIARTLKRIVRGLYFADTGVPLPLSWEIRANLSPAFPGDDGLSEAIGAFEAIPGWWGRDIGNGVFRYRMVAEQAGILWLLIFYDSLPFLCEAYPPGQ
jgi:hypothetical protein